MSHLEIALEPKPYMQGYLAAAVCKSRFQNGNMVRAPRCPFQVDTQDFRSWFSGVVDCAIDQDAEPIRLTVGVIICPECKAKKLL